jgi:molybdopterin-guanine dinucleotide biosynthesis protein A
MLVDDSITGVILAGGKSRRFGENKALSLFNGERLIERLLRSVRQVTTKLLIVTNSPEEYEFLDIPMVGDLIVGAGSLGGIFTGIKSMTTSSGIFIACDMPFIRPEFLRYIIEAARGGPFDAVVPMSDHGFEPLCALYTDACIEPIERRLAAGDLKIVRFYDEVRVRTIHARDTSQFVPEMLFNVNTRSDYEEALRLIGPADGNETSE